VPVVTLHALTGGYSNQSARPSTAEAIDFECLSYRTLPSWGRDQSTRFVPVPSPGAPKFCAQSFSGIGQGVSLERNS
jgi:hypothetical protein